MADYNKTFDGAARDAVNANVIASEWDPEYNSIQNAIFTKGDKIVVPDNGKLIETDGIGDPQDSGIDPVNLDQTSPIQTQLDGKVNSLGGDVDTNHFQAGNFQVWDGAINSGNHNFQINNAWFDDGMWHSIGPTGSGADQEVPEMDPLPSSARAMFVGINGGWQTLAGISAAINLHVNASSDVVAASQSNLACRIGIDYPFPLGIKFVNRWGNFLIIPLDTDQTFQVQQISQTTNGLEFFNMYYWGFIVE